MTRVEQGGGIALRRGRDGWSALIVRAKKNPAHWIFPKGHIERGETPADAALRETREEAGVVGDLHGPVGEPLEFDNGREPVRVHYFLIFARDDTGENDGREKRWLPIDDALRALSFESSRELLREAVDIASAARR